MRAATMEGVKQPIVVRNLPDPKIKPNGAIVRVEANGICRSDWHAWVGDWTWLGLKFKFPHVLGHEFCGVIEEVGPEVRRFAPGDRVLVPFSQGCGACEQCNAGHTNVCENGFAPGFSYWGGFGRLSQVPLADVNLVAMPEPMTFLEGAALGCRYMTAFHGVVDRARVSGGEWVAVHGCGGVGLSVVQIATALGANVIAVDIDPAKLEFAERVGAVETVLAGSADPAAAIQEITKGGAHVAVDALGIRATCENALHSLRIRGRHLQIGQTGHDEQGLIAFPIDVMIAKELTVVASQGMQASRYDVMLNMIEKGRLAPSLLVSRTLALEEVGEVMAAMEDYSTLGFPVIDRY